MVRKNGLVAIIFGFIAALVFACGSGSGSGEANPAPSIKGHVELFVSDSGSSARLATGSAARRATPVFDRILVSVSAIDLLGSSPPARVFTGSVALDLMALGRAGTPLAFSLAIPSGTYDRIRLTVEKVESFAAASGQSSDVRILDGGVVEVGVASFAVSGGEISAFELEFDPQRSIQTQGTGGYLFRPVIFAKTIPADEQKGFLRLAGRVHEAKPEDGSFVLCRGPVPGEGAPGSQPRGACLNVLTSGETSIFAAAGFPADLDAVKAGADVIVAGHLTGTLALDGSAGPLPDLEAATVFPGDFVTLYGSVEGNPDPAARKFMLRPGAGQSTEPAVSVDLLQGAVFVTAGEAPAGLGRLGHGQRIAVDGLPAAGPDARLRAALVMATPPERIEGEIVNLDPADQQITLSTPEGTLVCIRLLPAPVLRRISASDQGMITHMIGLSSLAVGDRLIAVGSRTTDCFETRDAVIAP